MQKDKLIIDTVLLAGKIMIENGSDMTRVDDTLKRLAKNAGIKEPLIFETTTGIMMSVSDNYVSKVQPIERRRIDLERISRVNMASRAFQDRKWTLGETYDYLTKLDETAPDFRLWWQLLAAGAVGSTLEVMYGGSWLDFIPTLLISVIGYFVYYSINSRFKIKFVSEFLAAVVIGIVASLTVSFHFGEHLSFIIIGSIMTLVPGVPLTNAVRDLLAGHILSGVARAAEALISAGAIGMGIALVLRFM